jgi:hypothetical protein
MKAVSSLAGKRIAGSNGRLILRKRERHNTGCT